MGDCAFKKEARQNATSEASRDWGLAWEGSLRIRRQIGRPRKK